MTPVGSTQLFFYVIAKNPQVEHITGQVQETCMQKLTDGRDYPVV